MWLGILLIAPNITFGIILVIFGIILSILLWINKEKYNISGIFWKISVIIIFSILFAIAALLLNQISFSLINRFIYAVFGVWRYDENYEPYFMVCSWIFYGIIFVIFSILLYKIYANLIHNKIIRWKIIKSIILIIIFGIAEVISPYLLLFAGVAGLCGNSCNGVNALISQLIFWFYGILIILVIILISLFRIWSNK